jgi:hypothetical protein
MDDVKQFLEMDAAPDGSNAQVYETARQMLKRRYGDNYPRQQLISHAMWVLLLLIFLEQMLWVVEFLF